MLSRCYTCKVTAEFEFINMAKYNSLVKKLILLLFLCSLLFIAIYWLQPTIDDNKPFMMEDRILVRNPGTRSFATAVKKSAPAVVCIQTARSEKNQDTLGSGIIFDPAGHILTNYHVIKDAQEIKVKLADGRSSIANIIGTDADTDLAVLKIELDNVPVIKFGNSNALQVGDIVLAIGNPLGLNNTVTQGIISAIGSLAEQDSKTDGLENIIQTDATINLGNSGGALVDTNGNLIGINSSVLSSITASNGIGFAIPSATAIKVAQSLIQNGHVSRGWIGAQLSELPGDIKRNLKFNAAHGIYVQDTVRNSPAQKAGLLPGDIITKVNNAKTLDVLSTVRLIAKMQPQDECVVEVYRNGANLAYNVTVAKKP